MQPEPGEQVFFHGHPSWRAMIDFYLKGLLAVVVTGAIAGIVTAIATGKVKVVWVVAVALVTFALILVYGLISRLRRTYTITNQRLTINTGLLARDLHETRIERVQNVNCRQSMLERMLGVGTVDFDTAGSAEFDFAFRGVSDPRAIVRTVDQALKELRQMHPGV